MANVDMTRRFFIGGACAFGAFGAMRWSEAFAAVAKGKAPNLVLGILSDLHVTFPGGKDEIRTGWGNEDAFRHALEWYREQGVDAVVITGDLAEFGMVNQIKAVADVWEEVFPGDKGKDGRHVEKIFITGNHDFEGTFYEYARNVLCGWHKEAKADYGAWCKANALRADIPGLWKKYFHEDYEQFYRKDVKGYTFLCQHWDNGTGVEAGLSECAFGPKLKAYLDEHGKELAGAKPFFYLQHPHPKGTCYLGVPGCEGEDLVTTTLSKYPNAIALSGHSHLPLTDERAIWQGGFTSVGTSSLRNSGFPGGYDTKYTNRYSRQGMLWKVYDDCIVMKRREFLLDRELGPDWVMALPMVEPKPFDFAARRKKAVAPEFAAGAKLVLKKGKDGMFELLIPATKKVPRCFEFEVVAEGKAGEKKVIHVLAEGFNFPEGVETRVDLGMKDVVKVVVTPMDCWKCRGRALIVNS
jgi:predicted MPP superfamily phosphohydrolase